MSNSTLVEYRIPVALSQDERVQDLARKLAKERGKRRIPIRQLVREALDAFLAIHAEQINPR